MYAEEDLAQRAAALERLRAEVEQDSGDGGRRPVFSEGTAGARLMIVGEAPAEADERTRRPFSGPAGRLLRASLVRVGIEPAATYLTNVVKCRPTRLDGGAVRNRPPTRAEITRWSATLDHEIELVRPGLILALGATAANRLLGPGPALTERRGTLLPTRYGMPCLATMHPAYLLRLEGEARARQEALYEQDLNMVRRALEQP